MNLPGQHIESFERWIEELSDGPLADFQSPSADEPDPWSALFFTNYPWHWAGNEPAGRPTNIVVTPLFPEVKISPGEIELLSEALFQYGAMPAE